MATLDDLRERLWETAKHTLFCSKEHYFASLEGWEIVEGAYGVRVSKGPAFHWLPCGRLNKSAIRDCIQPLIDQYGYAETITVDARQKRFNEKIGFVRIGEIEDETIYRITTLRV